MRSIDDIIGCLISGETVDDALVFKTMAEANNFSRSFNQRKRNIINGTKSMSSMPEAQGISLQKLRLADGRVGITFHYAEIVPIDKLELR